MKRTPDPTLRIVDHPVLGPDTPGATVRFTWNGDTVEAREGEPIAAALFAVEVRTLRTSERAGTPRGVFCNIGHCFECRVVVDGQRDVRACLTLVRAGMRVASQGPGWDREGAS